MSAPQNTLPTPSTAAVWRVAALLTGMNTILAFVVALTGEKTQFLCKDALGLDPSGLATFALIAASPSYGRPLWGSISDLVPLFGYHRRSYFLLASLIQIVSLSILTLTSAHPIYGIITAFVTLAFFGVILRLLVVEAVSVRVGNATGQVQRLLTLQFLVPTVLAIAVGAHLSGYVTQHWTAPACYLAATCVSLCALPLVFLIDERRIARPETARETAEERAERLRQRRADRAATGAALGQGLRSPGLWAILAFVFYLQLTPKSGTASFFYQVDALHLTKQELGNLSAYGSGGALAGYLLFGALASRLPMRLMLAGIVLAALPVYLPQLWMHDYGSVAWTNAIGSLAGGWLAVSLATLAARACPPRIEALVFGCVMAVSDLGSGLGNKLGSALYVFWSDGHRLAHGWHAVVGIGLVSMLSAVVFVPFLPAWTRSRQPLGAGGIGRHGAGKADPAEPPLVHEPA